jgi:hypothetical protein
MEILQTVCNVSFPSVQFSLLQLFFQMQQPSLEFVQKKTSLEKFIKIIPCKACYILHLIFEGHTPSIGLGFWDGEGGGGCGVWGCVLVGCGRKMVMVGHRRDYSIHVIGCCGFSGAVDMGYCQLI